MTNKTTMFYSQQKLEESGKEVAVGATRVDAEALVQELIESTDLNPTEVDECECFNHAAG